MKSAEEVHFLKNYPDLTELYCMFGLRRTFGVNSIDIKNIGQVFGQDFGPKLKQVVPVSISLPRPANRTILSRASFRANFWAKMYVH